MAGLGQLPQRTHDGKKQPERKQDRKSRERPENRQLIEQMLMLILGKHVAIIGADKYRPVLLRYPRR